MRFLIIISFLFSSTSFAEDFEKPPEGLEDGEYTFKLKSGNTHKFDSNKWKIVPRVKHERKVQIVKEPSTCTPVIEFETVVETVEVIKEVPTYLYKPNRVSLVAGYGVIGLDLKDSGNNLKKYIVEEKYGLVLGLRYVRQFNPEWSSGFEYLTGNTSALSVGYGW